MGFFNYFGTVLIISLFWGFTITMVTHALPEADRNFVVGFEEADGINTDFQETGKAVQESLQQQKQVGLVELAGLALFSGNIMLDLAVNSFFAIPSMFYLLFWGIFQLIPVNDFFQEQLLVYVKIIFAVVSTVVLLRFILGIRSQSLGAV